MEVGKKARGGSKDEQPLVKAAASAAAWGWYRYRYRLATAIATATADEKESDSGGGGGGVPLPLPLPLPLPEEILEDDDDDEYLPSRKPPPQPSSGRFGYNKLHHQPMTSSSESCRQKETGPPEISLLDSYEIQRISRQLDVYINNSSRHHYYKSSTTSAHSHSKPPQDRRKVVAAAADNKFKMLNLDGFWPCCSSHDLLVVEAPTGSKLNGKSFSPAAGKPGSNGGQSFQPPTVKGLMGTRQQATGTRHEAQTDGC